MANRKINHPEIYAELESVFFPSGASAAARAELIEASETLGARRNATLAEIQHRYRLMVQRHPERVGDLRAFVRAWHALGGKDLFEWV